MHFVKIPAILSTVPDLSSVAILERHRQNRGRVLLQVICPYFGWITAFRCVCDVTIAQRIAPTAANKVRYRNCPDKCHYYSYYNLRNSALVFLKLRQIICFQNTGFDTDFQNTGLLPAFPKSAVKYRPRR